MKRRILLTIIVLITMSFSCGKSSTGPEEVSCNLTDLVGTWEGEAGNSSNFVSLELTVDSVGKVSGSGVSSVWFISSTGEITGGGSFGFISGSSYIIASASWSLQLNSDKTELSGEFDVAYSGLHDMDVNLTKQ
jgi:hypothetical protein